MSAETQDVNVVPKPKSWFGARFFQIRMLSFALNIAYSIRFDMSLALVAMTDQTINNSFKWNAQIQNVILSSFFWGYVVLQIPAGLLAARFGSKKILLLCMGINSATSVLIPVAANYCGWQYVCTCRLIQGLAQGCFVPCMHHLIGKWAPLDERNRLGTTVYAGAPMGIAFQLSSAGYISKNWGWPVIFYINAAMAFVWTVVYAIFGSNSPQALKSIKLKEKLYIEHSLGHVGVQKRLKTPWKSIFTSVPFISLIFAHCGQTWGSWTLLTIPTYMSSVLSVDVEWGGILSTLPYIGMLNISILSGPLSDFIVRKKWISVTALRKISNSIGHYGPAIVLIGFVFTPATSVAAVSMLTLMMTLNSGHFTGYLLVHLEMAPNFAGTLMGITNFFASVVVIIAPFVAGAIIKDETSADEWKALFYLTSAVYIVFNTIFVIFGTSERQKWNDPESEEKDETVGQLVASC